MKKMSWLTALLSLLTSVACMSSFVACTSTSSYVLQESNTPDQPLVPKACNNKGVWLQVLGSGGPELTDNRASSSYLIWVNGESRVLVDAGSGSSFNFERAGADFSKLDMILLSHLHVDHSADLPAFVKGSFFTDRSNDLKIVGPGGNHIMPATDTYVKRLFKQDAGAYQYLGNFLSESQRQAAYKIYPEVYQTPIQSSSGRIKAQAVNVTHGPIPALAWRLDIDDKSIVFSGDMAQGDENFINLLDNADIFVAHNAVPEGTTGVGRNLHMPPSVIGEYAAQGKVNNLVISHRMNRTLGKEKQTNDEISKNFKGKIEFSNDLDCFQIKK